MGSVRQRGPAPVHQEAMTRDIRGQIACGALKPGDRLPTHQALVETYGVSLVTAQRAVKRLSDEGFVRSEARRGRFVADDPPCLRHFALVFPGHPQPQYSDRWGRAFAALLRAAEQFNRVHSIQWVPYFDVAPVQAGGFTASYTQLEQDLGAYRLAGAFFASPHDVLHAPLFDQSSQPLAVASDLRRDDLIKLTYDRMQFVRRAVDYLAGLGRRRIAWLTLSKHSAEDVMREVRRAGADGEIQVPPEWVIPLDPYHPDWLEHALHVLFNAPTDRCPEGMVIADDHLVEPAARVIEAMGVAVPDTLAMVGEWNWPLAPRLALPLHLIGFDAGDLLRAAAGMLADRRLGTHLSPPITETEFQQLDGVAVPVEHRTTDSSLDTFHNSVERSG